MDIATAIALIVMGFTVLVGCVWYLRKQRIEEEKEYYASFEV